MNTVPRITTIEEFTSKVRNSTRPVLLFCLPIYQGDFSAEVKNFTETHSHLTIYGINSSMIGQLARTFEKVSTTAGFMLWKGGEVLAQFSGTQVFALMAVLQVIGEKDD
ncbi:hypothetical protein ACMYSQ_012553 [Aspergillus niger]